MGTGFALTAFALWQMTGMTLQMDSRLVIVSGFIQGLGMGFTFVPLSTATFATLPAHLRHDGTPIFSLLRNIGSSVGISIMQALLAVFAAGAHERLAENVNRSLLDTLPQAMSPATTSGLELINAEVTRQATYGRTERTPRCRRPANGRGRQPMQRMSTGVARNRHAARSARAQTKKPSGEGFLRFGGCEGRI